MSRVRLFAVAKIVKRLDELKLTDFVSKVFSMLRAHIDGLRYCSPIYSTWAKVLQYAYTSELSYEQAGELRSLVTCFALNDNEAY